MRSIPLPPLQILKDLFDYDPVTGRLVNKITRERAKAGKLAGRINRNGYRQVRVNYIAYYASRIIWKLQTGEDPGEKEIDHINGNREDNRWDNLRLATRSENLANKAKYSGDLDLPKGVYRSPTKGKYCACIKIEQKTVYLGTFSTAEQAGKAYKEASEKVFGEYTNTRVATAVGCTLDSNQ